MKTTVLFVAVTTALCASLALGGCNSTATDSPGASSQQRAQQLASDKSIPPQAQALSAQQNQSKSQMDAMRAKDAQKSQ